jgi:hypothetical protein
MAFDELRRLVVRRWYLVVAAALIAAVAGVAGYMATPPKYEAKATMLLLPSAASIGGSGPTNPYLALGGGLAMTADVLALEVTDAPVVQSLSNKGYRAAYTVAPDATVTAPVLTVTATDPNQAMAARTLDAVTRTIGQRLLQDQVAAKAPKNSYVSVHTLVQSPEPTALVKGPIRTGIIGALLGLLVGLVPLAVVEWRAHRRVRRDPVVDDGRVSTLAGRAPATRLDEPSPEPAEARPRSGRPRLSHERGTGDGTVATVSALAPSAPVEEPAEVQARRPRPQVSRARSGTGERRVATLAPFPSTTPADEPPEPAEAQGRTGRARVSRARGARPRAFGADG